jgi:hypothetical protein
MESLLDAIYKISDEHQDRFTESYQEELSRSFIYSLLLCLSDEDLTQFYLNCFNEPRLARLAEGIISKRIKERGSIAFESLVTRIFSMLEDAEYRAYVKLRTFLSQIIGDFPKRRIKQFFAFFVNSDYRISRNKAYAVAISIWSEEVEEKLWENWSQYRDEHCILMLAEKGSIAPLVSIFREVWESGDISPRTGNRLLKRVAPSAFEAVVFLKDNHPISYLYAAALAGKTLYTTEAIDLALIAEYEGQFKFALWCLGKTNSWEALRKLNSRLESIQEKYRRQGARELGLPKLDYTELEEE